MVFTKNGIINIHRKMLCVVGVFVNFLKFRDVEKIAHFQSLITPGLPDDICIYQFGYILESLGMENLHILQGIFYCHLEYFTATYIFIT
jgi:hypothetical protein